MVCSYMDPGTSNKCISHVSWPYFGRVHSSRCRCTVASLGGDKAFTVEVTGQEVAHFLDINM